MIQLEKNSEAKIKGVHILTLCDARSDEAKELEQLCNSVGIKREFLIKSGKATAEKLKDLYDEYKYFLALLHKKFKVNEFIKENITTTIGRAVLAQRLGGDTTYTGTVNYTALGTSNAAPAIGNTQLGTETYRKALTSGTDASNISYLETFFTASEVSGTFEEYGMFIDGTGAANSGQLFNRFITTVTKSVTETLNCQSVITFNDA